MDNLIICSKPREHRAKLGDKEYGPMPTEIQLVEELARDGINITDWRCISTNGYDNTAVSVWERKHET